MEGNNHSRTRRISCRLSAREYQQLEQYRQATACRKLSDYVRKVLLEKPVVTLTRNQSQDDALAVVSRLNSELNHLGNNFNQAVRRLHTLDQVVGFRDWILAFGQDKQQLFSQVEAIRQEIKKLAALWLQ